MVTLPSTRSVSKALTCATLALGLAAVGCSDSKTGSGAGVADCSVYSAVGETATCEQLCGVSNQAFCAGNAVPLDCNNLNAQDAVDVCGVPVAAPTVAGALIDLERSTNVKEFAGSGPVDLGCFSEGGYPAAPGTPQNVSMTGIAKIFKNGCQSTDLNIEVWTVKRTGGDDDGEPDQLIGQSITTMADCTAMGTGLLDKDLDETDCAEQGWDGDGRYECIYTYPDVPTETELLVKTSGSKWKDLYEYNVYFFNDEVVGGSVEKDVRALTTEDYPVIAQAALGKTITPGNGALAGEVHDCQNIRVINAVVNVNQPVFELTYFGNDEDSPLPDLDAKATGVTALYSALDMAPGQVAVAAAGSVDGALVGVGFMKARVYADSVTSVTFRGLRPYQLPTQ